MSQALASGRLLEELGLGGMGTGQEDPLEEGNRRKEPGSAARAPSGDRDTLRGVPGPRGSENLAKFPRRLRRSNSSSHRSSRYGALSTHRTLCVISLNLSK